MVPYHRPSIGESEISAVISVLKSGWLTTGDVTRQFESEFAQRVGAQYAVAVNSATAAMHLALVALGIGPDDEVIVPTHTFAATSEVVIYTGATPVLVDVHADTLNVDPEAVNKAITSRTSAIMPVHFTGQAADMDPILELAGEIPVIEDAAHAFPTHHNGRPVGSIGTATAFSFYANKTITTGEGGMLTTNDENIADKARMLSLHGLSNAAWSRFKTGASWEYDIVTAGFKYNLTDIASALGLTQLRKAYDFANRRRAIAARYTSAFAEVPAVKPVMVDEPRDSSWHLYIIRLELEQLSIDRNKFIDELTRRQIGTSVHYKPLHLHTYYRDRFGFDRDSFPVSSDQYDRIISLPIFPDMTIEEVDEVIEAVSDVTEKYGF